MKLKEKMYFEECWGTNVISEYILTNIKNGKIYLSWNFGNYHVYDGIDSNKIKWFHKIFKRRAVKLLTATKTTGGPYDRIRGRKYKKIKKSIVK